ncbi:MAG: GFA family protein [Gammaproteobacteria bacterium]|nr:GFA family protein [Gammaproteobacteria bacterium]
MRFEVQAPAAIEALDCNCSICRMSGYLHLIVPATHFRLLTGADDLHEYRFNTGTAVHRFCRHCGIKSFYVPRSHPDGIDVNVRHSTTATARLRPRRSRICPAPGDPRWRVSGTVTMPVDEHFHCHSLATAAFVRRADDGLDGHST